MSQLMLPHTTHSPAQKNYVINITLEETWMLFYEELMHQSFGRPDPITQPTKLDYSIDKIALKKTTATTK